MAKLCFSLSLTFILISSVVGYEEIGHKTDKRKGKSLFVIVNFPNEVCTTNTGYNGTCLAPSECIGTGGAALGSCAKGFGICCYYYLRACGGEQTRNQTYLQNPNWPGAFTTSEDVECKYTFSRLHSNVCQLRLDFDQFELGPPLSDNVRCTTTTPATDMVTLGHGSGREESTTLCGYNSGQHVYLDLGTAGSTTTTDAFIKFRLDSTTFSSFNRKWNIKASQIECDRNYHAPQGCLQYFYGNHGTGTIIAFNYDNPSSGYIGHLSGSYTICVRRERSQCVIAWTPPRYSEDPMGLSVSGNANSDHARGSCRSGDTTYPGQSICKEQYK